jgi:hypothetical protein
MAIVDVIGAGTYGIITGLSFLIHTEGLGCVIHEGLAHAGRELEEPLATEETSKGSRKRTSMSVTQEEYIKEVRKEGFEHARSVQTRLS